MNNIQTIRFNYKFSSSSAVLMVLAAMAVTVGIGYLAYANPDVRITRLLSGVLSPEAPPMIFWALTGLSFVATLFTLVVAFKSFNSVNYIELRPNDAFVPSASISMSPIAIPYRSIRQIKIVNVQSYQMAVISSSVGEARLLSKFFTTAGDFTAFLIALEQRRHG
jgi:hypothetical protein